MPAVTFGLGHRRPTGEEAELGRAVSLACELQSLAVMPTSSRPLALVTGASSGIGLELARCCVYGGYDAVIAASSPQIHDVALGLSASGAMVEAVQADLATQAGVDELYAALGGRQVHALLANAGRGLGHAFLDQGWDDVQRVIDTNVTGTLYLLHKVGSDMRAARTGRILITGSIAGFVPGTFQAVYNGTKALLDSFSFALRAELQGSGVSVTCLMPGATETDFFEAANMLDTKVGASKKQAPEEVAKIGFEAMLRGDGDVIAGWGNKLRQAIANITPSATLASQHAELAKPGSAA